jgi:ATP-binding protein involved in chromosome partitioning
VARAAEELGVPFLGEIPFVSRIMQDTDDGTPPALRGDATMNAAKPYYDLAERIHDSLTDSAKGDGKSTVPSRAAEPTITFE